MKIQIDYVEFVMLNSMEVLLEANQGTIITSCTRWTF
jgi:hypothetical protein